MTTEKIVYATEATANGGRDGRAASGDGRLDVSLSIPAEFGGPGGTGTNPEQLFAAGYAACFLSAIKLVGRLDKLAVPADAAVTAKVGVGVVDGGYEFAVELVVLLPGIDHDTASKLVAGAHERCPFSKATRGNIDVVLTIANG